MHLRITNNHASALLALQRRACLVVHHLHTIRLFVFANCDDVLSACLRLQCPSLLLFPFSADSLVDVRVYLPRAPLPHLPAWRDEGPSGWHRGVVSVATQCQMVTLFLYNRAQARSWRPATWCGRASSNSIRKRLSWSCHPWSGVKWRR